MIVDLFAGPGGWSEGLRMLGHSALGIEWDEVACQTARAAGHHRLQADVAALDPARYPCDGLIASPPCQAYSMAGKGAGRRDVDHVLACLRDLAYGYDTRAAQAAACEDERSILVVEPLRWALALRPKWIALEQVPPVLELWRFIADLLRARGYGVWTGILEAERYGVPQTRERAVLMARLGQVPHPPRATHQRYVPGESPRHDMTLEGEVLPWVSMAEALGWDAPVGLRAGTNANDVTRPVGSPAPTIRFAQRMNDVSWVPVGRRRDRGSAGSGSAPVEVEWVASRPATTVNGDPCISEPGHHDENVAGSQQRNAVRVSVQEAAVLQSFRPDYPWQGSRTKQFEQVGNAVPPLLARAVLAELVEPVALEKAA